MFSIGNGELERRTPLKAGDTIICPHCRQPHEVEAAEQITHGPKGEIERKPSDLLYYNCGENTYIAGVGGKSVVDY